MQHNANLWQYTAYLNFRPRRGARPAGSGGLRPAARLLLRHLGAVSGFDPLQNRDQRRALRVAALVAGIREGQLAKDALGTDGQPIPTPPAPPRRGSTG